MTEKILRVAGGNMRNTSKPKIIRVAQKAPCPHDRHEELGFSRKPKVHVLFHFEGYADELMCATCVARERRKIRAQFIRILVYSQRRYDLDIKQDRAELVDLLVKRFDVTPQIAGSIIEDAVNIEKCGALRKRDMTGGKR